MNRKLLTRTLTGAVLASSIFALVGCGESTATISAQSVATFESTYDALSSAALAYSGTPSPNATVMADIIKANRVVYPYVQALRTSAESGGSVSQDTFAAATVALQQFSTVVNETGTTVSIPSSITTAAGTPATTASK